MKYAHHLTVTLTEENTQHYSFIRLGSFTARKTPEFSNKLQFVLILTSVSFSDGGANLSTCK